MQNSQSWNDTPTHGNIFSTQKAGKWRKSGFHEDFPRDETNPTSNNGGALHQTGLFAGGGAGLCVFYLLETVYTKLPPKDTPITSCKTKYNLCS